MTKKEIKKAGIESLVASVFVPGLGQILGGAVLRGVLILMSTLLIAGLLVWSRVGGLIELTLLMNIVLIASGVIFWILNVVDVVHMLQARKLRASYLFVVVGFFVYLMGWQVTEIDTVKFLTEFPDAFVILTRVAWPWDAAFQKDEETVESVIEFATPCVEGEEMPAPGVELAGEPWLIVDPVCGDVSEFTVEGFQPGTEITLVGGGLEPNTETVIWWADPINNQFRPRQDGEFLEFYTDENGEFEVTLLVPQVTIPSTSVGVQVNEIFARQTAEIGNVKPTENLRLAFNRLIETIFLALMATTFGVVLAIPVSFFAARNLMDRSRLTLGIYFLARGVLNIFRSIEPLIWATIAVAWVGLGPFAGVIALTIHSIAALGKLYSEAIESIDSGPIEAVQSTGATWPQMVMYAVIPQVIPPFMSFTIYRWDINVRMSTIIGAVGGGGIGFLLFQWIRLTDWENAGIAVWMIAITVMILDYASAELRKRFV